MIGCLGGLGLLVLLAIAFAILERAMSKGLAPIGATIPVEVVQLNLEVGPHSEGDLEETVQLPQKGDRLDLTVQRHAKLASGQDHQVTPSLGFILARRNECLITFPAQTQVSGYQTTTLAATFASLYYDLRGGLLLLGHPDNDDASPPSQPLLRNKSSQDTQTTPPSMMYLLLDSRWCTWLKVHEGLAIASTADVSSTE